MPRLLLFAPFRQVIIDQATNNLSLISLMEAITLRPDPAVEIQQNAQVPIDWSLIAVWLREPNEENQQFEQRVTIFRPDGTDGGPAVTAFTMTHHTLRVPGNAFGFPALPGTYTFRLELRRLFEKAEAEWEYVAEFPLLLQYVGDAEGEGGVPHA